MNLSVSVGKVSVSIIGKNLVWKVSPIPLALLITKSIGDTDVDTQKVSLTVSLLLPIIDINNHANWRCVQLDKMAILRFLAW